MSNDWPEIRLADICESIDYGYTQSASTLPVGPKFLRITDIVGASIDWADVPFCEAAEATTKKFRLYDGDIVIARTGATTGYSAYIDQPPDAVFASYLVRLQVSKQAASRFVAYALKSPEYWDYIHGVLGDKSAQPNASATTLTQFRFRLPPLSKQHAIAHILGTLDDKIELNRRMNETLEALARSIFKAWFVDFDPVRAKREDRQPTGMDAETAALFPAEVEDSTLGQIPKGWKVATLAEHLSAEKGLSYKGEGLSKDSHDIPMHNLNSVLEGGGYKYAGIKYYTGEYKERHLLKPGDIIVTNTEQGFDYLLIGYPAIVPKHFGETGIFSHHIFRVRALPESLLKAHFVYYLLMSPLVREQITGCTNGTTVNMLSADGLRIPRFVLPSAKIIEHFEAFAAPIFAKMEQIHEESLTLAALRDALLPKLLSGEVRIEALSG